MKISKLFHWLYASLMFLPLLVAPIFAIYSHRHTIDSYSVTRTERILTTERLNYCDNGLPVDTQYFTSGDILSINNGFLTLTFNGELDTWMEYRLPCDIPLGHKFYVKFYLDYTLDSDYEDYELYFINASDEELTSNSGSALDHYISGTKWVSFLGDVPSFQSVGDVTYMVFNFALYHLDSDNQYLFKCFNLIDLTSYFGDGNEPNLDFCNTYFSNDFYDYYHLVSHDVSVVYDDTDIGSQFLYDLYNTTDKYLNFDSVLNLYQVNEWINLNVFNGNAPLVWSIIWHYLDYWLLLSIFWLCFDVLIYVPQLAHRWLDKASLE